MSEKTRIEGCYFKDAGSRPFEPLMSGMALPLDNDGVCRDKKFVNCDFHPVCEYVKYEGCEFIGCNGHEFFKHY